MNSNQLHITNGDSTTEILKTLRFKGTIITWREMLCEGKTITDVGSENFWKSRFNFLAEQYKITKQQFIDITLKEYRNLCNQKSQNEIILWFEYDLFCQINMIAVISWLKKHREGSRISLVCSGDIIGFDKKLGLSELSTDQLMQHYEDRIHLTIDDVEYADYIWQLYCSDSPLQLQQQVKTSCNSHFKYLTQALTTHLKRFPTIKNGLNEIENEMLHQIATKKPKTKKELIKNMLLLNNNYGFGDLQYFNMYDELKELFKKASNITLNDLGAKIYQKEKNYYPIIKDQKTYLGGSKKYNFLYNEKNASLLKL